MHNQSVAVSSTLDPWQTIDELNKQAAALQFKDPVQARSLAQNALALAQSVQEFDFPYQAGMGESLTIVSRCAVEVADYSSAIDCGLQAVALGEQLPVARFLPQVLGLIGYAHTRIGLYVDALRYFIRQQQISVAQVDHKHKASAYMGRGLVYSFSGDQEKAIAVFQASLQIFQEIGDQFGQTTALTNMGNAYEIMGDYATALRYGFQALSQSEAAALQGVIPRLIRTNIGTAYLRLGDLVAARTYLNQAMTLAGAEQDPYIALLVNLQFGRLYSIEANYAEAILHLQVALAAAVEQGQKMFEYEAHKVLAQVYQATGEAEKVITHLKQFYTIRDSVLNLQNKTRLGAMELEQELETARREAAVSKRLAAELERQVEQRTADLRASLDRETHLSHELESALVHEVELQRLKTHIINTASHEFRTPLSIISLSMEMLCDRLEQLSPEKRVHYRERIREQILYLTDMLQDIFTINTSNDVEPEYAPYRFGDFCRQLEQTLFRELQHTTGITFIYADQPTRLIIDFQMVKRILFNLIVNAIKFSQTDTPIQVYCEHTGRELILRVVDQGIGIPIDEQTKIFELFYRGSNVEERRGLGLGLSIVQKLTSALHGKVTATSLGPNQGSTFAIQIPIGQQPKNSRVLLG